MAIMVAMISFLLIPFASGIVGESYATDVVESPESDFTFIGSYEVTLSSYKGTDTNVVIPSIISGGIAVVTKIGDEAFRGNYTVESIVIPNTVVYIGDSAFAECENLKTIVIPDSVVYIGNSVFQDSPSLESITLPNSIGYIGKMTFTGCEELREITLPETLTRISDHLFAATPLESVVIPDSIISIGFAAFQICLGLQTVTISDGIKVINEYAFDFCPIETVYVNVYDPENIDDYIEWVSDHFPGDVEFVLLSTEVEEPEPTDPEPTDPEPTDPTEDDANILFAFSGTTAVLIGITVLAGIITVYTRHPVVALLTIVSVTLIGLSMYNIITIPEYLPDIEVSRFWEGWW